VAHLDAFRSPAGLVPQRAAPGGERIGHPELAQMTAAAAALRECRRALAARGGTIVEEALAGADFAEGVHYPPGEAYDPQSHAQYFYHAHRAPGRPTAEHGHFHTFLRAEGMPPGAVPLLLPEIAVANAPAPAGAPLKRGGRDEVSHLVAIALDVRGEPVRLFTTNRWVTGETWYRAEDVVAMADRFGVAGDQPSALLNCWIGALLRLFRPQIAKLLVERDRVVMAWRERRRAAVFDDRRLEIPSSLAIDLDAQLAAVDEASAEAGAAVRRGALRLPPMAEGWDEG
jgi:Domain of unknown function (DUF6969)